MRARTVLLVLATAAVVVLALLNWPEFTRPSSMNLVWRTVDLPLALVLLGLLALSVVVSLASGAAMRSRHEKQAREQARELQSQRELADRAEASRFLDLRQTLDTHLRESRQRESSVSAGVEQALMRHQRESRTQLEGLHRALTTRMGEMEARLDNTQRRPPDWPQSPAQGATRDTGERAAWQADRPAETPAATAATSGVAQPSPQAARNT